MLMLSVIVQNIVDMIVDYRGGSSIFRKWGPNKNTNQRALARLGSALGATS